MNARFANVQCSETSITYAFMPLASSKSAGRRVSSQREQRAVRYSTLVKSMPAGKRTERANANAIASAQIFILYFCMTVLLDSCRLLTGEAGSPTVPIPSRRQFTLRIALSSGVSSSLSSGERMLDSGASMTYSIGASARFGNPQVYLDGQRVPLTGTVFGDKPHDLVASADSLQVLSGSDSSLIVSISRVAAGGNATALVERLGALSDSLLIQHPSDSAVRVFARLLSSSIVPERDASLFVRAVALSEGAMLAHRGLRISEQIGVDGVHTEIMYVNGITTTPADFDLSWRGALRPLVRRADLTEASGFGVSGFYNRTATPRESAAADFFMCVRLKWLQIASNIRSALLSVPGCFPVGGITIDGKPYGDFAEALQQMINLTFVNGNPALVALDAVRLADSISVERKRGKRLLLVTHSQGNLMMAEALSYLRARQDWLASDFKCVGWVSIAPPRTPLVPSLMNMPSAFIVRGQNWYDILDPILSRSAGNESVIRLSNTLSATYDGSGWVAYGLTGTTALSIGSVLHAIVGSYLQMPETAQATKDAILQQVSRLDRSCSNSEATIEVTSNIATSWRLNPNSLAGSGTSGSFTVQPLSSGSEYSVVPAAIGGSVATTTNPDGTGTSMVLFPRQIKRFTITYSTSSVAPSIISVAPTAMIANDVRQTLIVLGDNFQSSNVVQFKWAVGAGSGVWNVGNGNPPTIANTGQLSISMNPGTVSDVITVRVCRSATQTSTSDCSSGTHAVTVTAPPVATPSVSLITPTAMFANDVRQTVTVLGANFQSGNIVQFRWAVGDGAGVWNVGNGNPPVIANTGQLSISMNPGVVNDVINVRVCRSVTQTTTSDCSTGSHAVTVTAPSVATPTVSSVTPTAMIANDMRQTVTVLGANFQTGNIVQFRWAVGDGAGVWNVGNGNPPVIANAGQLSISMNPGVVTDVINLRVCRTVTQTSTGDCSSGTHAVTVTAQPVDTPSVSSITPTAMIANDVRQTVTVLGANFQSSNVVQFRWAVGEGAGVWNVGNGNPPTIANVRQLSISMNPGAVTDVINVRVCRSVTHTSTGDCSSGTHAVTVTAAPAVAPSVTQVAPTTMSVSSASQTLTVLGANFQIGNVVQFRWAVGAGAGVWNAGSGNPPGIVSTGQLSIRMFTGPVSDVINVRVCRSATQTSTSDCSSGSHAVTVR